MHAENDNLYENDLIIDTLSKAISDGDASLSSVPNLIIQVCERNMWKRRVVRQTGEVVEFERFTDFVRAHKPEGLGEDVDTIQTLISHNATALTAFDAALQNEQPSNGRPPKTVYNIHSLDDDNAKSRPSGTTKRAALRRLRKDRPDLLERVTAGELTPNEAMIEAGFRPKRVAVNCSDMQSAAKTLASNLDYDMLVQLTDLLLIEQGRQMGQDLIDWSED